MFYGWRYVLVKKIVSVINNIFSVKKWRIKKFAKSDFYSFAEFVNNAQFHTGECAVNYGAEGGLRNAAFEGKRILGHFSLFAKLGYSLRNGFI